jgi:hypothetical protein
VSTGIKIFNFHSGNFVLRMSVTFRIKWQMLN